MAQPVDSAMPDDLNWESSDPSTAVVVDGLVTGMKPGQVTITGTKDNCVAKCEVLVTPGLFANSISVSVTVGQVTSVNLTDYYQGKVSMMFSLPDVAEFVKSTIVGNNVSLEFAGKKVGRTTITITDSKSSEQVVVELICKDTVEIIKEKSFYGGVAVFVKNNGMVCKGVKVTALFKDASGKPITIENDNCYALGGGEETVLFLAADSDLKQQPSTYELSINVVDPLWTTLKQFVAVMYYKGGHVTGVDYTVILDVAPGNKAFGEVDMPYNDGFDTYEAYLVYAEG